MRNMLLGSLIGLVVGAAGAIAYERYLGMGPELAQTQADLASTSANLAKAAQDSQHFKSEADAISAQLNQVSSNNDDLKHEVDKLKKASVSTPSFVTDSVQEAHIAQELLRLKSRLNLTPEQEAAVKAAMEGICNNSPNAKTVDETMSDILNPEQKAIWQ
jgi:hypothetical protein